MSCISLTLQMSINSSLPLPEDVDPMSETLDRELSVLSMEPKASPEAKFDLAAGVLLTGFLLLEGRGRAKLEPPKPESDLEFEPSLKLGWSSFGVVRGSEYFGLLESSKVEFALGNPGEKPCPKLNELTATAAVADSVVQTRILRSEA